MVEKTSMLFGGTTGQISEKGINSLPPEILMTVMIKTFSEYFISVKPICSPDLRLPPLEWPGISNAGMQVVGAGKSCHRQLHLRHPWLLDHRNFIYTIIGWEGALCFLPSYPAWRQPGHLHGDHQVLNCLKAPILSSNCALCRLVQVRRVHIKATYSLLRRKGALEFVNRFNLLTGGKCISRLQNLLTDY